MPVQEGTLLFFLKQLMKGLEKLQRRRSATDRKKALSAAVAELLKTDPDIDSAEADILALEAVGVKPSPELLRARRMLTSVKTYKRKVGKVKKKKAAKKKMAKKKKR